MLMNKNHERADKRSVLNAALAAVLLILAGLSLMVLDDSLTMVAPAQAAIHR